MTESCEHKLAELNDLINDTHVPLRPELIWQLAEEISRHFHGTSIDDREQLAVAE